MTDVRYEHRSLDLACELGVVEAGGQAVEWQRLREEAGVGAEPIPGGVRLWLRSEATDTARDLIGREAACCGFLDIELAADGDRLRLDVTSPAPGAGVVIAWLTGLDPQDGSGAADR